MNKWYEVTITTTTEAADLIADVMFSLGSDGVSIKDKQDLADLYKSSVIWDYIDEKALNAYDDFVSVKAVFGGEEIKDKVNGIEAALIKLKENCPFGIGAAEIIVNQIADTDWRTEWKKYYKPIVTSSVTVVPKWIRYDAPNEKLLYINPGMAFGTGEHETTKMCLELLSKVDVNNKSVLDIGTGSGILGIASLLVGAKSAYMCDIDPDAIKTATENVLLNSVENRATIECADLLKKAEVKGDLIFANITADILIMLSNGVISQLNEGGYIILSGIINNRLNEVSDAYEAQKLKLIAKQNLGEWNALLYKK